MQIKDINDHPLTITDLKKAIRQAKLFKDLRHVDPGFLELDKSLKMYWTDIYNKLIELKNKEEK